MKDSSAPYIEALVRYFREGIKEITSQIGVEAEHFILRSGTGQAAPYGGPGGVRAVLERMLPLIPGAGPVMGEDLLGFTAPDYIITLEPAAQLEISIRPLSSLRRIGEIYGEFRRLLDAVLEPMGLRAVTVGCQPESPVDSLEMIPKERYRRMDAYFRTSGSGGREMMRGTASLQVSVDYSSEEDFRRKMQGGLYFAPVFMLLCDNSERFQGRPLEGRLKRADIWERTDSARCGVPPGAFSENYGFRDYAGFLGKMPLIFREGENGIRGTGKMTVAEIYADKEPDREEIEHIISMAFPHVRLKHFLEIRVADAVPRPYFDAYCALVKGLLYSEDALDLAEKRIREASLTEAEFRASEQSLMRYGWEGMSFGRPVYEAAKEALALAEAALPPEEKDCLRPFEDVLRYKGISRIPRCGKEIGGEHDFR